MRQTAGETQVGMRIVSHVGHTLQGCEAMHVIRQGRCSLTEPCHRSGLWVGSPKRITSRTLCNPLIFFATEPDNE